MEVLDKAKHPEVTIDDDKRDKASLIPIDKAQIKPSGNEKDTTPLKNNDETKRAKRGATSPLIDQPTLKKKGTEKDVDEAK